MITQGFFNISRWDGKLCRKKYMRAGCYCISRGKVTERKTVHKIRICQQAKRKSRRRSRASGSEFTNFLLLKHSIFYQRTATVSSFSAILLIPFTICAFRSSLGLRTPIAYCLITAGLIPISLETPAMLIKS